MTLISLSSPQLMEGGGGGGSGISISRQTARRVGWFGRLAGDVRQLAKVNKLDLIHLAWSLVEALLLFSLLKDGCWGGMVGRVSSSYMDALPPLPPWGCFCYRTPSADRLITIRGSHTLCTESSSSSSSLRGKAFPSSVSVRTLTQIHTKP